GRGSYKLEVAIYDLKETRWTSLSHVGSQNRAYIDYGEYTRHPAPDQIDSQHRANYQGDANGGGVKNAQSAAACPGWPSVCGVDEQGAGFAATADRSQTSPLAAGPRSKKGAGRSYQHGQRLGGGTQYELAA